MSADDARRFLADAFARSPWAREKYLALTDADALARVERVARLPHPASFAARPLAMARKD